MNDTLDVLRYWLPEWEFDLFQGDVLFCVPGQTIPSLTKAPQCADHLAAELRRKYLEREQILAVNTNIDKEGKAFVTLVYDRWADIEVTGDTELLATIEAGKRLKEALEPGEGT